MEESHTSATTKSYTMEREMMAPTFHIFNELRLTGALCDVVLVADGVEFEAHKIILCGCSTYFRALFTSDWDVKGKGKYNIPGVSPEGMNLVIEYAYTHSVLITVDNVESLLAAGDQLNIPGIVQHCSDFLTVQLCVSNCVGIYSTADSYCLPELRQSAFHFLLENFTEVASTSEEFLKLTLHQLCEVIEKDELRVEQEEVVFDAVLRWIFHEPASRKAHISVLLPKVRMARMDGKYFIKYVMKHDLVKGNEECRPIFNDTLKVMCDLDINGPPQSDFEHPLVRPRLPADILLAIGGWNDRPSNVIEAYDSRADRWVNVTQQGDKPRAHHGMVYLKGFVYCIGGCDGGACLDSVHKFDPIARTWHTVAPMQSRRCYSAVTVLDGSIYVMGGRNADGRLNTVERYDPETDRWSFIQPMNAERSDASAATLHGKIYICGGFNGAECLATVECYDPITNRWSMIAPMRTPRHGVGVIAHHGRIYAVGGTDRFECLRSVEVYDPLSNHWHAVAPMFNRRCNFGIEVVDDQIFVVGGQDGFVTITTVECYDAGTGNWYRAQDIGISRATVRCCVVPAHPCIIRYAAPRKPLLANQGEEDPSTSNSMPNG
uniref:Kelch like family member 10 n=1 Tax=Paramormyrops kingsleyae TaxID=1676925 RepID=A0A3B3TG19_9TELE|nr:kelch-like protein 10 [Paramormyrops kingsleyae]